MAFFKTKKYSYSINVKISHHAFNGSSLPCGRPSCMELRRPFPPFPSPVSQAPGTSEGTCKHCRSGILVGVKAFSSQTGTLVQI